MRPQQRPAPASESAPATPSPPREVPPRPDVPAGFGVKRLNLVRMMQVPGHPATDAVEARRLPNGSRWEIEYIPAIRHHRITFWPHTTAKPVESELLYEGHVRTWIYADPAAAEPAK